ncbi:MAG: PrsW family intramembrane metalloprotease [Paludibacteraceae bacterium]|nr:PrsW family intramembrane metalloprotease [Paludibacteraceae bacterium]
MNNIYVIILAAVLPAFLLVLYIWWKDKYQREPFGQMAKGFVYGIVSAGIAIGLETGLQALALVPGEVTTFFQGVWKAFLGAAIPEELAKLFMLWLLLRRNKYFDERFDGIVYAACVGMGFAATENIIYLFSNLESWQSVAVSRAIFAVPGHFMFAVCMGYFYSMVYFGDMSWRKASRVFWAPVLLHGVYDSLLFVANLGTILSGIILLAFYIFCFRMLKFGRRRINEHLERDKKDPTQIAYWKE